MRTRRRKQDPLPSYFTPLAIYNAERARGVVHTPEGQKRMELLQRQFNEWSGSKFVELSEKTMPPLPRTYLGPTR